MIVAAAKQGYFSEDCINIQKKGSARIPMTYSFSQEIAPFLLSITVIELLLVTKYKLPMASIKVFSLKKLHFWSLFPLVFLDNFKE